MCDCDCSDNYTEDEYFRGREQLRDELYDKIMAMPVRWTGDLVTVEDGKPVRHKNVVLLSRDEVLKLLE